MFHNYANEFYKQQLIYIIYTQMDIMQFLKKILITSLSRALLKICDNIAF